MRPLRLISHPFFVTFAVQILLAYEWMSAGVSKIYKAQFVPTIGKTFLRFEDGNPHEWYVHSLLSIAKKYPTILGMLVQWGELLVGIGLMSAVILYGLGNRPSLKGAARIIALLSLIGGLFMNLNFYFAAGWSNASTGGLNVLMFWTEAILLTVWMYRIRSITLK